MLNHVRLINCAAQFFISAYISLVLSNANLNRIDFEGSNETSIQFHKYHHQPHWRNQLFNNLGNNGNDALEQQKRDNQTVSLLLEPIVIALISRDWT